MLVGYPEYEGAAGAPRIFNRRACWRDGAPPANYRKACLPNYRVFDEKRYFTPGSAADCVVELGGIRSAS